MNQDYPSIDPFLAMMGEMEFEEISENSALAAYSPLAEYAKLRIQKAEIELAISVAEQPAIDEALDIAETERSPNGKKLVHQDANISITLVFRKQYPPEKDDTVLENLGMLVTELQQRLAKRNEQKLEAIASQIEQLQQQISELESQRDELLTSPDLERLQSKYQERQEANVYYTPSLSARINYVKKPK